MIRCPNDTLSELQIHQSSRKQEKMLSHISNSVFLFDSWTARRFARLPLRRRANSTCRPLPSQALDGAEQLVAASTCRVSEWSESSRPNHKNVSPACDNAAAADFCLWLLGNRLVPVGTLTACLVVKSVWWTVRFFPVPPGMPEAPSWHKWEFRCSSRHFLRPTP